MKRTHTHTTEHGDEYRNSNTFVEAGAHTHQINPSAPFFNSDKNKSIQTKKYARVQIKSRKRVGKEGGRDEKAPFLRRCTTKGIVK